MIKVVIDTNVFVSAIIMPHSVCAKIFRLLEGGVFLSLISKDILMETSRVLLYPKIKKRHKLTLAEIETLLEDYAQIATTVQIKKKINVIKEDPSDNKFLECALDGKADFIISGDRHLLKLKSYKRILILSLMEFLAKMANKFDTTPPSVSSGLSVQ